MSAVCEHLHAHLHCGVGRQIPACHNCPRWHQRCGLWLLQNYLSTIKMENLICHSSLLQLLCLRVTKNDTGLLTNPKFNLRLISCCHFSRWASFLVGALGMPFALEVLSWQAHLLQGLKLAYEVNFITKQFKRTL